MKPVEQSMNLTSNQKAGAYLYGSMSSSGGPFFPNDATSMIDFYCNQTTGCGKSAGLMNYTLSLPSHRTFDYVPLTAVGEGYEFVLTSKAKVRMDSTSTGNQFLILRDIPCSGTFTQFSANENDVQILMQTNTTRNYYCIPSDDSGYSLVIESPKGLDSLPASAASAIPRNRVFNARGLMTLSSSIDLITDELEIPSTYLTVTSGFSLNIDVKTTNISSALGTIGKAIGESGFTITNNAIMQALNSTDTISEYSVQAIKTYTNTLSLQHVYCYVQASSTWLYVNYRTISIAKAREPGSIQPLRNYPVHIYSKPRMFLGDSGGICWSQDGDYVVCGDSLSNIMGPFGIFEQLTHNASQLVGLLESRANSTLYTLNVTFEQYYEGMQVSIAWIATIAFINAISVILISTTFFIKMPHYREDLRGVLTNVTMPDQKTPYNLNVEEETEAKRVTLLLNGKEVVTRSRRSSRATSLADDDYNDGLLAGSDRSGLDPVIDSERDIDAPFSKA
jgi:hypothetical protein